MSEQGWREFLEAEGVDDWVVLHGGAAAVFRVSSILDAARLATALADVPGLAGSGRAPDGGGRSPQRAAES